MNTREFLYVAAIYDEGSLTRAANSLMLSQASLSKYIINLEDSYGLKIFDRSVLPWQLTDFGKEYLKVARKAILLEHQLSQKKQDLQNYETGTLRVGLPITRSAYFLPKILPEFHRLYPKVELLIEEDSSVALEEKLLKGSLDLILIYREHKHPMLTYHEISRERFYLVSSRGYFSSPHPNADFSWLVRNNLVQNQPFILLNPWQRTRKIADKIFKEYRFTPDIHVYTKQLIVAAELCINGCGITFVPETLRETLFESSRYKNADYYPVEEKYSLCLDAVVRKDDYTSKLALEFIKLARHMYV